jgi:hypothetical protein
VIAPYPAPATQAGAWHDPVMVIPEGSAWHLEGRCGHDGLDFDGSQPADCGSSTASVIGPLDPGNDRDPQFLAGGPASAVEDVLLQQTEEELHGRVVTDCPDLPIDPAIRCRSSARTYFRDRNCDPRSLCGKHPSTCSRRVTALSRAVTARRDFIRASME